VVFYVGKTIFLVLVVSTFGFGYNYFLKIVLHTAKFSKKN